MALVTAIKKTQLRVRVSRWGFIKASLAGKRWTLASARNFVQTSVFGMVPFVLYAVILPPGAVGLLRIGS